MSPARPTLMKDMGGDADANNKMFLLKMKESKHSTTTYDYYDYKFFTFPAYHKEDGTRVEAEHFLVFRFPDEGTHWVIRLGEAKTAKKTISAEGRVLCEDMGANDFDFNDVVFDAYIMLNGDIQIEILAHGGELDIAVADRLVTLDKMSNTGQKTVNTQKFTITNQERQEKGWNSIASIPVVVYPKGFTADDKGSKADDLDNESFPLEANTGKVPQKVCAPVGTKWPDEFIRISYAYTSFGTWVSENDPARWTFETKPRLVNLKLTDNSNPEQ